MDVETNKQIEKELKNTIRSAKKHWEYHYLSAEKKTNTINCIRYWYFLQKFKNIFIFSVYDEHIYYSSCSKNTNILCNNEKLKLDGYGDYDIMIYKIPKTSKKYHLLKDMIKNKPKPAGTADNYEYYNNYIFSYMDSKFKNLKLTDAKSFFDRFCDISIYEESTDWYRRLCTNIISDECQKRNDFMFETIFGHKFKDHKKIILLDDDGNGRIFIIEFEKEYFIVNYSTS